MAVLALASIKASPGVTATAITLTGVWSLITPMTVTLLECDPAGGDAAARLDLPPEPGLVSLAASVRHGANAADLWQHAHRLPGRRGHVVPGPVGPDQARAAVRSVADSGLVAELARSGTAMLVADCGRLDPDSVARPVLAQANRVLLVVRPRTAELAHLALRLQALRAQLPTTELLLVGAAEYSIKEIITTLRTPVAAHLPYDRRGAELILRQGLSQRRSTRLPLVRACRTLAERLVNAPPPTGDDANRPAAEPVDATTPPKAWLVGRPMAPDDPAQRETTQP
ncbi:hypothetical protein [Spirillospora sp. NPDC047279]|uniref:hypothetical protein n=1 Tax=Spirillospora sp. NPDC047279 TaxID=3155478 RepID=UPI0033C879F4